MVLCVSRIHRPEPERNEQGQLVPQQPYLTLTDGWYHIKAFGDEYLCRAITRRRITVGMKLGIAGAQVSMKECVPADVSSKLATTEPKCSMRMASPTSRSRGTRRTRRHGMPDSACNEHPLCAVCPAWPSTEESLRCSTSSYRSRTRSGSRIRTTHGIPGTRTRKKSARGNTRLVLRS